MPSGESLAFPLSILNSHCVVVASKTEAPQALAPIGSTLAHMVDTQRVLGLYEGLIPEPRYVRATLR